MAEDTDAADHSAGGKRVRPTHRDLITAAAKAGGREGAREVLIPLGIDVTNADSISTWHAERQFTRDTMRKNAEREKWVRKAFFTFLTTLGLGGIWAAIQNKFHVGP